MLDLVPPKRFVLRVPCILYFLLHDGTFDLYYTLLSAHFDRLFLLRLIHILTTTNEVDETASASCLSIQAICKMLCL